MLEWQECSACNELTHWHDITPLSLFTRYPQCKRCDGTDTDAMADDGRARTAGSSSATRSRNGPLSNVQRHPSSAGRSSTRSAAPGPETAGSATRSSSARAPGAGASTSSRLPVITEASSSTQRSSASKSATSRRAASPDASAAAKTKSSRGWASFFTKTSGSTKHRSSTSGRHGDSTSKAAAPTSGSASTSRTSSSAKHGQDAALSATKATTVAKGIVLRGGLTSTKVSTMTLRKNESSRARPFMQDLTKPFAEGAFRYVGRSTYINGPRKGQLCIRKWFKDDGSVFSADFFSKDIYAVDKAAVFVQAFNDLRRISKNIRLNIPAVWIFKDHGSGTGRDRERVLQEPFIQKYQKFNSNSGCFDDSTEWGQVMQALSHFSYHMSGSKYLLCDIQGGIHGDEAILTDPVILSRDREFGVTDLGQEAMDTFFALHPCNRYCMKDWSKPDKPTKTLRTAKGTSMVPLSVVTMAGAPKNTAHYG